MERLPTELSLKIFCWLDHRDLVSAQLVSRKWRDLASENTLWCNLFIARWGIDRATFYAPEDDHSKSWKDVYIVQDRCDRVGLGLKIIREGRDYFLVHRGEIQRHLASRRDQTFDSFNKNGVEGSSIEEEEEPPPSDNIFERILCFIGDLEMASTSIKRGRLM